MAEIQLDVVPNGVVNTVQSRKKNLSPCSAPSDFEVRTEFVDFPPVMKSRSFVTIFIVKNMNTTTRGRGDVGSGGLLAKGNPPSETNYFLSVTIHVRPSIVSFSPCHHVTDWSDSRHGHVRQSKGWSSSTDRDHRGHQKHQQSPDHRRPPSPPHPVGT